MDQNTIWYLRPTETWKISLDRHNGGLRTVCLRDNRLVGYKLAGDTGASGVLHSLLLQQKEVRPFMGCWLDPAFGQGHVVWSAISAVV